MNVVSFVLWLHNGVVSIYTETGGNYLKKSFVVCISSYISVGSQTFVIAIKFFSFTHQAMQHKHYTQIYTKLCIQVILLPLDFSATTDLMLIFLMRLFFWLRNKQ